LITLNNQKTFIALTALWAFVEAGLGGFLHALHLPFTGIVLGGFAVLIISLLAMCYDKPFAKIVQATLIVLAIKAAVNQIGALLACEQMHRVHLSTAQLLSSRALWVHPLL
jgi:hypothetical protein